MPSNVENLRSEYNGIVSPVVDFMVRKKLGQWVTDVQESKPMPAGISQAECFNVAIAFGAMRRLAIKHSVQLVFSDGKGHIDEPPLMRPDFVHKPTDISCRAPLTLKNHALLTWTHGQGVSTETAVDDGLHLVGAAAARPGWSLIVQGLEPDIFGLAPLLTSFSNAPAFPANPDVG
jgi:hypothetical protein